MGMLISVAAGLGAVIVLLALTLFLMQPRLVFHPMAELVATPAEVGLAYESVRIPVTERESIHAWYFPAEQATVTILFCHGNAGNISHRLETAAFFVQQGVNALIFDYRGYGESDGTATEEHVYADARAAYDWLRTEKKLAADQIVLMGRSLGGAVAVDLAGKVPCRALILESTFSSAADMARELFPLLPVHLLLRYRFDSLAKVEKITAPVLMVHSPTDEIVPYAFGRKLFEGIRGPKRFHEITGGHNDREYLREPAYQAAFRAVIGPA